MDARENEMTTTITRKVTGPEYVEIHRKNWSEPRPAQRGCPAGTDHFTAIYERGTWPEDGTRYAGIEYESCWVWIGDEPGRRNAVVSHSTYPADRSPLRIGT